MHAGIILDGNRRYAEKNRIFPRFIGHMYGKKALEKLLIWWAKKTKEPKYLTLYVFSLHNMQKRSRIERHFILKLIESGFKELLDTKEVFKNKVHISFIGNKKQCPKSLVNIMEEVEAKTNKFKNKYLTFCICYDGQEEITNAFNEIAAKGAKQIDKVLLKKHLYTRNLPQLDLLIRTGGEKRLSGFLLWDASYAELIFHNETWPEYDMEMFENDIAEFKQRNRRFGK